MDRDSNATGWFLLGGVVGAVAALLMAPMSGKQARRALSRRVQEGLDEATAASEALAAKAETVKDETARLVDEAETLVGDAASAASDAFGRLSR
jgi:gas vesicle protein